jgi:hypothetical protein
MERYSQKDYISGRLGGVYGSATERCGRQAYRHRPDVIVADARKAVSADVIRPMPKLRQIHSQGVAYNL